MKTWFEAAGILVAGALVGSFLGKFVGLWFPSGSVHDLFATDVTAGLQPTNLDLRLVDVTFGCVFRFNVTSVFGIVLAALLYKRVIK